MGTWTNTVATLTEREFWGKAAMLTYEIAGLNTNTGGTLTTPLKKIYNCRVNANTAAGMVGGLATLQARIEGRTVVVSYTDPGDSHTVRITVWGVQA